MSRLKEARRKVKSAPVTGPGGYPRRFDSYVLLKPLARGGMGQLYLALTGTPGLEKLCVIKQVIPDLIASENSRRFRDEALVALRLAHGNMVSVFDAGMVGGQIFLAMEHIDGKDLLATWNRCAEKRIPFPIDISVYIVKEVARALVYAHAFEDLKLVHRDVSPANVLLSYTGEVKLTDFGLAMSILKMERTTPGIVYGKLSYLSPEQARRMPLDGRVDIYAAGILLWELLTGRQLFPISSPTDPPNPDAMARARNPEVVAPSKISSRVPAELDRIVMRALAVEREDRYPTAELLRADLAAFLAETAPKTDADRLVGFLRQLCADDAREEKRERERLITASRAMLSGAIGPGAIAPGAIGPAPAVPRDGSASLPGDAPREPGSDPRIGTTLGGRYHIRRLCGEGAMGRVYEAQHIDIGRRVAIKVLHARYHHSADLVERFRREARAASKIGHPNIVDVTDSGTTPDGAFYFVMEFLDGESLEELIAKTGPLPIDRALLIAAQIARALEAAHAAEVIHRDLKPANVMLVNRHDEADFVKVLDFGISKDLDPAVGAALTRPDVAIGTPAYMAPEQAAGKTADALTDVYAVGGLLYEMLTATPPCSGEDAIEVLQRKATEDPRPIGELRLELPRDLQKLVMRALARAPSDRHWSMTALKEQILTALTAAEGAPAPVRSGSNSLTTPRLPLGSAETAMAPSVPVRVPVKRIRLGAPAVAIAVVIGAGALVGVRLLNTAAEPPSPPERPIALVAAAPASPPVAAPIGLPEHKTALATGSAPSAAVAPAPPEAEPRKQLAAAERHAVTAESVVPAALHTPATRRAPAAPASATTAASLPPSPTEPAAPAEPPPTKAPASRPALPTSMADTTAILNRGQTAFDRGDYQEAIRQGRQAIAAGAEIDGRLLIGDVYFHLERYREAVREYDAALARDPGDSSARRRRDLAREKAGQAAVH
jgi:serine/threonine protein kinase